MSKMTHKLAEAKISPENVHAFVDSLFHDDLHAKRILSLSNATLGVLQAGALGIHAIGRGLAAAKGLKDKHAIKQVNGLIGNEGIDVWGRFSDWVPYVIANRRRVRVNLDWTEFDADDQSMLVISMQTKHGRSTPLLWKTFVKSKLKGKRNDYEDELLVRLREVVPENVRLTVVADRGFADHKLYEFLRDELRFEFVIRFRQDIQVTSANGESRKARDWLGKGGRMRVLRNASVTAKHFPVATVVCVQEKGMKEAWCIVASDPSVKGQELKKYYGKRFSCEEMFRDIKDLRYGMGMSWNPITRPERRDRMFFVAALAYVLLNILGEAGERVGLDRVLKSNTSKKRTLSLFRQGLRWFELIPNMPEERLQILMKSFVDTMKEHSICRDVLGVI
jgi:hypothetical protein